MMYRFEDKVYAEQQAKFVLHQLKQANLPPKRVIIHILWNMLWGFPIKYDYLTKYFK